VQASDHFGSIQARSEPVDRRKIAPLDKTIAALDHLKGNRLDASTLLE
jgi:hypothetical protein